MRVNKEDWMKFDDEQLTLLFQDRIKRWRVRKVSELMQIPLETVSSWLNQDTVPDRGTMEIFLGQIDVQPPEEMKSSEIIMSTKKENLGKTAKKIKQEKIEKAAENLTHNHGLIL